MKRFIAAFKVSPEELAATARQAAVAFAAAFLAVYGAAPSADLYTRKLAAGALTAGLAALVHAAVLYVGHLKEQTT